MSCNILEIEDPSFLKDLSIKELQVLANDIRKFLIDSISKTGGHLASNLGVVEITLALHKIFNSPNDKILFDVGHQCYTHKILTGRAKHFNTLRKLDGISGYMNCHESVHDAFESGHSSNTLSAMCGMLLAQKETNEKNRIISVIGDASIANGMAFEALMFMGCRKDIAPIIILNDNEMAISKPTGSFERALTKLRISKKMRRIKGLIYRITPSIFVKKLHQIQRGIKGLIQRDNIFEDLGFDYFGPYDGNDIKSVIKIINQIKNKNEPTIIHFMTKKGKGYEYAENDNQGNYHGIAPFDIATGKVLSNSIGESWSEIVSNSLLDIRKKEVFSVITPAMLVGSKLERFKESYPKSIFDCGIAEEHAATMASGMAIHNSKVFLTMYSTFAQRAYDQILNDIARANLPVVIGIDRAGVVGEDGQTHQGIFDISALTGMPNTKICMPSNPEDCYNLIRLGFNQKNPFIIRYPKSNYVIKNDYLVQYDIGYEWKKRLDGTKLCIISYGPDINRILHIINQHNLKDIMVIEAIFIKPIDEEMLRSICDKVGNILIYEQVVFNGSLAQMISSYITINHLNNHRFVSMSIDNMILEHGNTDDVLSRNQLGDNDILNNIKKML